MGLRNKHQVFILTLVSANIVHKYKNWQVNHRLKRVFKGRHWRKNRRTKIYNHFKDYYKCYAWNKQSNNKH